MSGEGGIKNLRSRVAALETGGGPSGVAWGGITGTLSSQTDLQTALNGKASTSHSHIIADVTGLQTALDGKQAVGSYAAASHSHIIADVTSLQTALDGKAASSHTHTIANVTGLQAALDGKQAAGSYQPLATVLTNTTASFTTALETKLNGIAAGATANDTDANLKSRANHTGTQAASTITGLATVATSGSAADLTGNLAVARLNGGTGASASTFWCGDGTWKAAGGGGSDPWTWTKLASNSTVSTTAYANVSGLSFSATANTTYIVELFGAYQTAATTTGIALALDVPTGATVIGQVIVNTSATALLGLEQIADATATGVSTGVRALNTNTPIWAKWIVAIAGTAGTVQLMQRSEVAASNTVLQANITALGYRTI